MSNIPCLNVTDGGREEDPVFDYRFCLLKIGTFFSRKGKFREHQRLREKMTSTGRPHKSVCQRSRIYIQETTDHKLEQELLRSPVE